MALRQASQTLPLSVRSSIARTRVNYVQLGRSGLRVSNPILGCMGFGDPKWLGWTLAKEQAMHILNAAYERGVNTWDTANAYSNGTSERIIGEALRQNRIQRRKVVIMTKCYRPIADDDDPATFVPLLDKELSQSKDYVNQYGLSRRAIIESVNGSLERLRTDYIDLLQIHRFDSTVPPEEIMETLHDLIKSGKVRYIGASSMWAYQFSILQHTAERNGWTKFISMQNHYNLLYREEEREMNKFCKETNVGLIPWSPLAMGRLARPLTEDCSTLRSTVDRIGKRFPIGESSEDQEIIRRVHSIAEKRSWSASNVALAWINNRVTAPVIGVSSVGKLDACLEARGKVLTEEEQRFLEEPYVPKAVYGHE
ncbi:putative aldo-keto reductase [Aspergillus avenaceus]|uniref:Putative aldo-keto reductase n=1 Tax=Aspergillus avenaceus TaxID=36643 RepID=A0A5N6TJ36_ASPAV|nr:putative aldo-keto reductase [Aspergillus avenaceus]